jgi:hypothetical protein
LYAAGVAERVQVPPLASTQKLATVGAAAKLLKIMYPPIKTNAKEKIANCFLEKGFLLKDWFLSLGDICFILDLNFLRATIKSTPIEVTNHKYVRRGKNSQPPVKKSRERALFYFTELTVF